MTLLRAALAALALAPGRTGDRARIGPLRGSRRSREPGAASFSAQAQEEFNLVGLHWKGPGTVWFRTASPDGAWSGWHAAAPEAEDTPDSARPRPRHGAAGSSAAPTGPGAAAAIQYRFEGRVTRLRAYFVWSDPHARTALLPGPTVARATQPTIVRRSQWGADESIVRANPYYASAVRFAVVHHTAGTNSYSASESAAIVRGIQRYHVLANGWNDIGYNFLVDKYGQVFEGRGGGITKNVVGAHAEGFNTGSIGVAVLGNYESQKISAAARAALVEPPRVAPRRRARRPARQADLDVRRKSAVPGRDEGAPAGGLRPPGHRPDELPRRHALRPASGNRGRRCKHRAPEALQPGRHRKPRAGRFASPRR